LASEGKLDEKAHISKSDTCTESFQYGFRRWKPNLKLAFKNVFTYKQWKRLARELDFPLNATPTELTLEQWLDLYHGFRHKPMKAAELRG
jgi:hypothetical protein